MKAAYRKKKIIIAWRCVSNNK